MTELKQTKQTQYFCYHLHLCITASFCCVVGQRRIDPLAGEVVINGLRVEARGRDCKWVVEGWVFETDRRKQWGSQEQRGRRHRKKCLDAVCFTMKKKICTDRKEKEKKCQLAFFLFVCFPLWLWLSSCYNGFYLIFMWPSNENIFRVLLHFLG